MKNMKRRAGRSAGVSGIRSIVIELDALHEAAHAFAAVHLGIEFTAVRVYKRRPRIGGNGFEGGHVRVVQMHESVARYRKVRNSDAFVPDLSRDDYDFLTMMLAPAAFDARFRKVQLQESFENGSKDDLKQVRRFLRPWIPHFIDTQKVIKRTLRRADRLVKDNHDAIVNLAWHLQNQRRLSQSEVVRIIGGVSALADQSR